MPVVHRITYLILLLRFLLQSGVLTLFLFFCCSSFLVSIAAMSCTALNCTSTLTTWIYMNLKTRVGVPSAPLDISQFYRLSAGSPAPRGHLENTKKLRAPATTPSLAISTNIKKRSCPIYPAVMGILFFIFFLFFPSLLFFDFSVLLIEIVLPSLILVVHSAPSRPIPVYLHESPSTRPSIPWPPPSLICHSF